MSTTVQNASGTTVNLATSTDIASAVVPQRNSDNSIPRYKCSFTVDPADSTPGDIALIKSGSTAKAIRLHKVKLSASGVTTHTNVPVYLRTHTVANTGGTAGAQAEVPLAAAYTAATAVVTSYTTNPTTDASAKSVAIGHLAFVPDTETAVPVEFNFADGAVVVDGTTTLEAAVTLAGTSATVASGIVAVDLEWTEE